MVRKITQKVWDIWLFALSKNPERSPRRTVQSPSSYSHNICLKSKVRLQNPVSRSEACLSGGKCYCNTVLLKQKSAVFPIVPCIPRRAASLLLCSVPGAPLFPAAVSSYSHSNAPCKAWYLAVFKTRVQGNETDSRKSYGSIPFSLVYLPRVLRIHTNHPVRAEEKPGPDSPRRVLNQRCYMRLASFIQILIQEICNKSTHALIKNSSYPIIFIVTYISVYYCYTRKKIKRRLYLWR